MCGNRKDVETFSSIIVECLSETEIFLLLIVKTVNWFDYDYCLLIQLVDQYWRRYLHDTSDYIYKKKFFLFRSLPLWCYLGTGEESAIIIKYRKMGKGKNVIFPAA